MAPPVSFAVVARWVVGVTGAFDWLGVDRKARAIPASASKASASARDDVPGTARRARATRKHERLVRGGAGLASLGERGDEGGAVRRPLRRRLREDRAPPRGSRTRSSGGGASGRSSKIGAAPRSRAAARARAALRLEGQLARSSSR